MASYPYESHYFINKDINNIKSDDVEITNEQSGDVISVECQGNEINSIILNNENIVQNSNNDIFFTCLTSSGECDGNQFIQIIPQNDLSNYIIADGYYIDKDTEKFYNIQGYYPYSENDTYIKIQNEQEINECKSSKSARYQECFICSVNFSSKRSYLKHMLIHENDREYKCSWCKFCYNHEVNLLVHTAVIHTDEYFDKSNGNNLNCPVCHCVFTRKKALQGHCLVHQKDEELGCNHCSLQFKSKVLLEDHLIRVKKLGSHPSKLSLNFLKCKICFQVFENVGTIKKHYLKEHPKNSIEWSKDIDINDSNQNLDFTSNTEEIIEETTNISMDNKRKSSKKAIQTIKLFAQGSSRSLKTKYKKRGRPKIGEDSKTCKSNYSCETCKKVFKTPVLLKRHDVTHTGEKPFECSVCGKRFTQKSSVKIHMATHEEQKAHKCSFCYKSFTYEHNMNTHIKVVHKSKNYIVNNNSNSLNISFDKNKIDNSDNNHSYVSDVDINQYLWSNDVQDNLDTINYKPNSLNDNIYVPSTLEWDRSQNMPNKGILVSESIEKLDKTTGTVQIHEIVKDNITGFKRFRCHFCGKFFKNSPDLTKHMRIHTNEKPYQCYMCRKTFRLRSVLKSHFKSHWKLKEYTCSVCNKNFNLKKTLKIHEKMHDPTFEGHICKFCDRKFTTLSHFKYHLATHQRQALRDVLAQHIALKPIHCEDIENNNISTDKTSSTSINKPYKCKYCDKSYKLTKYLQFHVKEHFAYKPETCPHCFKLFTTSRSLKQHIRLQHSNNKKFSCSLCSSEFLTKSSLKRHGLVHKNIRPYMCPICQRKFKAKLYCERHIKKNNCVPLNKSVVNLNEDESKCGQDLLTNFNTDELDSNSNILITNYVNNSTNNDRYVVVSLDEPKMNMPQQINSDNLIYFDSTNYTVDQNVHDVNTSIEHNDSSDNLINLLDNNVEIPIIYPSHANQSLENVNISQDNCNMESESIYYYTTEQEIKINQSEYNNNSSLADKFPILRASLFSDEDQNVTENNFTKTNNTQLSNEIKTTVLLDGNLCTKEIPNRLFHGCANCEMVFKNSEELVNHSKSSHKLSKGFVCNICYKAFSADISLWAHSKTHESTHIESKSESCLSCIACNQQFVSVSSLSRHVRMQHNDHLNFYKCIHCDKTYKTTRELDSHIKQILSEYDALMFNSSGFMNDRINNSIVVQTQNNQERFSIKDNNLLVDLDSCKINQLAFLDETSIEKPSVKELIKAAKEKVGFGKLNEISKGSNNRYLYPYICIVCNRSFNRTSNLQQHMKIHYKTKQFQCTKCSAQFKYRCSLKTHMVAKHSAITKLLRCHLCTKFLKSNQSLRSHMKMHVSQFDSEYNSYKSTIDNVSNEIIVETSQNNQNLFPVDLDEVDNTYLCSNCSLTFSSRSDFESHICPINDKTLYPNSNEIDDQYNSNYQNESDSVKTCNICNLIFSTESSYLTHKKIIHNH